MINFSNSFISKIALHFVGNQYSGELPQYSNKAILPSEAEAKKFMKIFSKPFSNPIQASEFIHPIELNQNSIFKTCEGIFDSSTDFIKGTKNIVKYLYEQSKHYSIKSGNVFIVQFEDILLDNVISNGIGIFKIETSTEFLKCELSEKTTNYGFDYGILNKNIEKCCLIFNYNYDEGFNVYSYEKNSIDSQYWSSSFLSIKKKGDDYNNTTVLLESIKSFVLDNPIMESKKEKLETFANTMELIQEVEESLNIDEFINQVLPNKAVKNEFISYLSDYKESIGINLPDEIRVSKDAINYQLKKNKSVIKLDKNFHIYIHGDESKIVTGIDENGKKYYKLYFDYES